MRGLFCGPAQQVFARKARKQERKFMENDERNIAERLEAATTQLERTLNWLEERQGALSGEVEKISATVEQSRRETELAEKLAAVERELAEIKAAAAPNAANPLRRTMPAATAEMLAKHGIGDGPVDVHALDAALSGLSLEQRIAVKTQLLRAGAIA
jgi:ATP-dependent Lon protease